MALPNIFTKQVSEEIIERINKLTKDTPQQWGKMNVAQMLAHCCVSYEYIYDNKYEKPSGFRTFIMKMFVKPIVVSEKPYKPSGPTAPDFIIADDRDFEKEKIRLIDYIRRAQAQGEAHFDGLMSHAFGKLNKTEWNNMMYKHLNHHLTQFGV